MCLEQALTIHAVMKQKECPNNLLNASGMIVFLRIDMYCILEHFSLYVLNMSNPNAITIKQSVKLY